MAKTIAAKALKRANYAVKQGKGETKYIDLSRTPIGIDWNGTAQPLADPTQGVGDTSNRVGDEIRLKYLRMKGEVQSDTNDTSVRLIVFYDKDNKYTATSDLLTPVGTVNSAFGNYVWDKRQHFVVLYDRILNCVHDTHLEVRPFDIKINLKLKKVRFSAGTVNIESGALRLLAISDRNTTLPALSYVSRLTYDDK